MDGRNGLSELQLMAESFVVYAWKLYGEGAVARA